MKPQIRLPSSRHQGHLAPRSTSDELQEAGHPGILIVDDNVLTAEGLALAFTHLGYAGRFLVTVTTADLRRELSARRPELVVLDADSVSRATCVELVAILHQAAVPTMALGGKLDVLADCMSAGVSYAIDKRVSFAEFSSMVATIVAGTSAICERQTQYFFGTLQKAMRARHTRLAPFDILTHREKCVLAELMEGRSADAIALHDSVSISTVRSQIKAILQKLGVNSQLAATALARQAGWTHEGDQGGRPR